jgi:hypothetical protein
VATSSSERTERLGHRFEKIPAPARPPGHPGLPERLRRGVEALSGISLDDVRVHYDSPRPAALEAHAFAQRDEIHLAPGQAAHLPHEAWHLVQQRQGRVAATSRHGGLPSNDSPALEAEATRYGALASRGGAGAALSQPQGQHVAAPSPPSSVAQFVRWGEHDDDDGRPLGELQAELEQLRRRPRREKVVSEQRPPRKKDRLTRREKARRDERIMSEQAVLGHGPARGLEEPTAPQTAAISSVRTAVEQLQEDRARRKDKKASTVYRKRAAFPQDASRAQIRRAAGGATFLDTLFGENGSYVPHLQSADVTASDVVDRANRALAKNAGDDERMNLKAHHVANTGETHITHGGVRLYTLHHGSTAFTPVGRAAESGREVLSKKGSKKEYIRDDRGTPTSRFAYAIKRSTQVEAIDEGTTLRGRFTRSNHPVFGGTPRTVMSGSHTELAELGRVPPQGRLFGDLTPDQMLYMHQEFGSGDRQRGVSIAGSPAALLSNEARGFAEPDDDDARKLRIDLSTVPRAGRGHAPNLVNFHQRIPGKESQRLRAPALHDVDGALDRGATLADYREAVRAGSIQPGALKYSRQRNQRRFDWSVAKNRELYLSGLNKRNIKGSVGVSPLERTDLARYPNRAAFQAELRRIKAEAREGEATISKIRLRKPNKRGKTRARRSGPKGRNI